ncbi:MAG: polyphosphate kinase 2 [Cyclobacteriaceae bacterium]|nr:polyphosphate kinase 2 [Cyclobacteriaceae bacterium]
MVKSIEHISQKELELLHSKQGKIELLRNKQVNVKKALKRVNYLNELVDLQEELLKMQQWVAEKKKRVVLLFEGRDAAGKGGAIRRFVEHMNPRMLRVVALPEPTKAEKGQWYFQRYVLQLPNPGEIVFFNRSWFNRAIVEPVNGYCTQKQYRDFMDQVGDFENMLVKDGIQIIKFWYSISKEEQKSRFESIRQDPLKQWKLSPIDDRAQELWDDYTFYKKAMFAKANGSECSWNIIKSNYKPNARTESIKYVLRSVNYPKDETVMNLLKPNPGIIESADPSTFT